MNTLAASLLATPDLMVDVESARLCILYVEVAVKLLLLREVFNQTARHRLVEYGATGASVGPLHVFEF